MFSSYDEVCWVVLRKDDILPLHHLSYFPAIIIINFCSFDIPKKLEGTAISNKYELSDTIEAILVIAGHVEFPRVFDKWIMRIRQVIISDKEYTS